MSEVSYPPPHPTAETSRFWEELEEGRLLLPWCEECSAPFFYPRAVCPRCWGSSLSWVPSPGVGRVVAYATVHRPGHPAFLGDAPYLSVVVELDEGVRITTSMDPGSAGLGDRVTVVAADRDGVAVPFAVPRGAGP